MDTIYSLVKEAEKNYTRGTVKIGKYIPDWNMYDTIERINAYVNSRHISGEFDALGREKPFFNIVISAVSVWFRATDISRKNIKFRAANSSNFIKSFIGSILLRNWMRKENFGCWLNKWGRTLAKYGSAVSKFVEKDGELFAEVVEWNKIICDPVSFKNNLKIERIFFTPAELRKKTGYNQEAIKEAIDSLETKSLLNGEKQDNQDNYIGAYEVHGELPLSFLTGKEKDEKTYRQQMHVIFINEGTGVKNFKDKLELTFYAGKEARDPYMLSHLIEEDGRTLSIGAVEYLFTPQWMVNDSVKKIKDQIDLASKMVLQTADEHFAGRNILSNLETGQILIHDINKPLTQVNNQSHDVPVITSVLREWQALGRDITGTPEAMTGDTMPSGTAYRQVVALQREAHSLFELMTENKSLDLENILKKFVIPYFKKQLNTAEEVAAVLAPEELERLDNLALPANLAEEIKHLILTEQPLSSISELTADIQAKNTQLGTTRFLKPSKKKTTWKEYFKDLEDDIEIIISGENVEKEATMTTLTTVLQSIASNPNILQDQNARRVFNKILEMTGEISPLEFQTTQLAPPSIPSSAQNILKVGGGTTGESPTR